MRVFRFLVLATATAAGALLAPARAGAHDFNATVDPTGDPVKVLAYFEEDPAQFADATVTDADGNEVAAGKTDARGVWTFPRPKPGAYTLRVKSTGHVAKVAFKVDGGAEGAAVSGWRMNKQLGLAIGVVGLLGASGVSWLLRQRRRRLE